MSLHRLAYAILLIAFFTTASSSPVLLDENDVDDPAPLTYLLKRRDVAAALPYELPEHLLKSMLKYRRY